ncbi:T9SS type A sorting domain-containing protein [uncultured Chryseobacterium sp.]|uniref:T9SS type A sorting domain-containing protein n=1 Tax=uncultured Chryseobacterium sp. TaxID=259322 RepID=UPI0037483F0B
MKKLLLTCLVALGTAAYAQVGPPQSVSPNPNNGYGFTQSSGTYTPLSASRTIWQAGAAIGTNAVSGEITIPAFKFNGKSYTSLFISNNGFITFGKVPLAATTSGLSTNSPVPNLTEGAVAGFSADLINANTSTSEISYETSGNKFTVQFTDVKVSGGSSAQLLNFQIQLDLSANTVAIIYGNCVSGTSTATGQVGVRGNDGVGDVNNRTGTNWTSTTAGTSNSSSCTLGTTNGTTVPAAGLTLVYTPGTWLAAPSSYASLPFNEDFSTWANGNSTVDLPNASYWRTWPSRGNNSWRQSDISTANVNFTSTSGWYNNTEGTTTAIAAPAVAPAARFHSYYATAGLTGNMDLYVNLASGGNGLRILSFDYRNNSGTDKLDVLLSTDGGATFSSLGSLTTNSSWTKPSYIISSNASNAIVRLAATSDYGSDDIFVDNLNISVSTTPPPCVTIISPANAATGTSLTPTLTWNTSVGAVSYKLSVGTTSGASDIMNAVDVGNVTTYTIPVASALLYEKTYYAKVSPSNSNGTATGCTETSFTTKNIGCPTVTLPASNAINASLTPTITWSSVTDATGYRLTVGTTPGASNVLNNVDLGNVTTYTLSTPLNYATTYYYTVNAYTSTSNSASCTERIFTTVCQPTTAPYTQNFDTTAVGSSSNTNAPACWTYVETSGSAGYGYVSSTLPASAPNCYYLYNASATTGNIMLVSPQTTNLADGTRRVRFLAKGGSAGYVLQVGTVSDISTPASFTAIGNSITLTSAWAQYIVNIPAGTDQNLAFRHGLGGTTRSIYIDDVSVEAVPACIEPSATSVASVTYKSAAISWTASSSAPNGNYDLYVSTSATAPAAGATPTITNVTGPYTLSALNPSTTYYVWVRSNCVSSSSLWTAVPAFTTATFCPSVTTPANSAVNVSLTPTITWTAMTGATGYKISMGTAPGATDVMNNIDVGNVLTYTVATPLNTSTSYFYTVNAYDAQVTSQSCTERTFNTLCGPITPSYTQTFVSFPGACWVNNATGGTPATGSTGTTTSALWVEDGFLNTGSVGSAKFNAYSLGRTGWLKTPVFNLSAGGYRVKFNYGLTKYADIAAGTLGSDDVIHLLVSQDGGATWTILKTWNASNSPSNTSNDYSLDLVGYTSANTMFAFYGSDGTVDDTEDVDFFIDNFKIEAIPTMGTAETTGRKGIQVYPNPFEVTLNIADISDVKSVGVVDVAGRLVKTIASPGSVLHLGELKSGMYILMLEMKDGTRQSLKVIKK